MAEASFGDWLRQRRLGLGLTQDQLAQQIHCSTSALRKFESEERRPSAEMVEQLAEHFDIPREDRKSFSRFARGDWQAFAGGEPDVAPWRLSEPGRSSSLPSSLTSFIGREIEQREVTSLLQKNRLVTVAGPGGIGKTRLALQVGHQAACAYPDGVWFVALDSLSDPLRLPQSVASVFGIQEGRDRQVIEVLIHVLGEKSALLILDNCEHLLEACATLARTLLTRCPNLTILATTREVFNTEGEATYSLRSLSTPKEGDSLAAVSGRESVRLFVDRATLALSTFQFTTENGTAIAEICRRLDGMPLAIELIAARVNILSVEEIALQVHKSLAILETKDRTALSRHRTLRASIDWSWSLLTDSEQAFMRQLSVFAGGWTLDSAQSVCDGDALDLTSSLAQKSLIVVEQGRGRETRYRLHAFLHEYSREKLIQSGELESVSLRHLKYFLSFSEELESGLRGIKQEQWHDRATDEWDNLNAALEQAAQKDVQAGLYLAGRLKDVWQAHDIRIGLRWLDKFLKRPESTADPVARARALCTKGWVLLWLERLDQACETAEESLALYKACHDRAGEIDALIVLASTYYWIGDYAEAFRLYDQALVLAQALGDVWRQATACCFMGDTCGDIERSFDYMRWTVELFSKAGDRRSQAEGLVALGSWRALNGETEVGQKCLDEAAELIPLQSSAQVRGEWLVAKSVVTRCQADFETADYLLQTALAHFERLGNRYQCLWITARLASIALAKGAVEEARKICLECAQAFQKEDDRMGVIFSLEEMARTMVFDDAQIVAARLIGWADATRQEIMGPRPRVEQKDIDQAVAACISRLGEACYVEEREKGRAMTLDEAVELALNEQSC